MKTPEQVNHEKMNKLATELTTEQWDALFDKANEIVTRHLDLALEEAEADGVPREIIPVQLLGLAVLGLHAIGWNKNQIVSRVGRHFNVEIEV